MNTQILSDEQLLAIQSYHWEKTTDYGRRVEAAVLAELKKQEPVAWVYYPKGVGEKYVTYTNPASLDIGKQADRIPYIEPLYAHPQPTAEVAKDAERYRWLKNSTSPQAGGIHPIGYCAGPGQTIDEAIDAAMKGGE